MITTLATPHQAPRLTWALTWPPVRPAKLRRATAGPGPLSACCVRSGHSTWLARQCLSVACHAPEEDRPTITLSLYVVESCSKTALLIGLVLLRSHRFMGVTRGATRRSRFPPVPALAYRWTRTGRGVGHVRALPEGRCARARRARLPARTPGPAQRVDRAAVLALLAVPIVERARAHQAA